MANNDAYSQIEPYPRDVTEIAHLLSQSFDKDIIIRRVLAHINRRLYKKLRAGEAKRYAMVITNEVEKLEKRLETIEVMFREEEKRIGGSKIARG